MFFKKASLIFLLIAESVEGFASNRLIGPVISNNSRVPPHSNTCRVKDSRIYHAVDGEEKKVASDEIKPLGKIELTDEKIADMIEVTFINACLQLSTGYVDVLKLFLAATNAAYENQIPLPKLMELVANSPNNTANRSLSSQEIDLRSGWMAISYLTLETLERLEEKKSVFEGSEIPEDARENYSLIIDEKVRQHLGLETPTSSSMGSDDNTNDPQDDAIMSYNMKIISLTLSNVEEGREADNFQKLDEDGVGPPRPNIPGAY